MRRGIRPVYISCSWDAHINISMEMGKAQIGKTNDIARDSHEEDGNMIPILMNVFVPKLGCAGHVWEGLARLVKRP